MEVKAKAKMECKAISTENVKADLLRVKHIINLENYDINCCKSQLEAIKKRYVQYLKKTKRGNVEKTWNLSCICISEVVIFRLYYVIFQNV